MSAPTSLSELYPRYVAAWAARDADAIVAMHTADTTFWLHHGQPAVTGRHAVRDAFAAMFTALPDFGFVVRRTEFGTQHWVLDWTLTCTLPSGLSAQWDCIDLVTVTPDCQVARKDTFLDGVQFERAMTG
jgi:uncharacterized protein (TIGR02246 family)